MFKEDSFDVLSRRYSFNNEEVGIFKVTAKVQSFVNTEYCVLDRLKISSDLDVLCKDGSFKVLSHGSSINNKEVSNFLQGHCILKIIRTVQITTRDHTITLLYG